jgi:hypothetical protein
MLVLERRHNYLSKRLQILSKRHGSIHPIVRIFSNSAVSDSKFSAIPSLF